MEYILEEDINENEEGVEVYYQTPEEFKNSNKLNVVHDDIDDLEKTQPQMAIKVAKSNPNSVIITKCGDKYYIDYNDLRCYMDACGEERYGDAINSIIDSNPDHDLSESNLKIIMSNSDLFNLDGCSKNLIDESSFEFEVYS